jgi:Egh16-like virulence factor
VLINLPGNAGIISQNLTVTNNVPGVNGLSQGKTQNFNITVAMPSNLACTGGMHPPLSIS